MNAQLTLTYTILENAPDGRSRFRDESLLLGERKPLLFLSDPLQGGRVQMRQSPAGYTMDFHSSASPQWTFVLQGALEIGLPDGTSRVFRQGDWFLATDLLPAGATFDPMVHGHSSRNAGEGPLVTALVRD
jgi:hypothetical protein